MDFPDWSCQYIEEASLSRESDKALHKTNRMAVSATLRNVSLMCQARLTGLVGDGHSSSFMLM